MAKAYKKQPLGRGLSALLNNPTEDIKSSDDKNADQIIGNVIEIPLNQIKTNPFQPRTNFESEKIIELANSISELGIIQPITVRKTGAGQDLRFELHKFGPTNEIMKEAKAFKIDMDSIAECTHLTKYFGPYDITKTNENQFIFTKGEKSALVSKNGW